MRTRILGFIVSAAFGLFAFFGVAAPAKAASVFISVSGVWGPSAEVTPFSAPDGTFTFGFVLPNPFSENPTTEFTDFSYYLNVTLVTGQTLLKVQFFPADEAGMFDLIFQNGDVVSLYGADIGSSLTLPSFQHTYTAAAGVLSLPATGTAAVTVIPLGVTGFGGGVPESSTRVMMTLGFAALAFAGYRTSRKVTAPAV
jgi:hypothetical protein